MPERSIGELIAAIRADVAAIGADTAALAKAEFRRDARKIGFGLAFLGLAGLLAAIGAGLLVVAGAWGLVELGFSPWAAYLIDAGVWLVAALAAVLAGVSRFKGVGAPKRTATALKDLASAIGGLSPEQAEEARAAREALAAEAPAATVPPTGG
ncbi:MAG: phage holin family protein [Bifidobacteriaceae bacterium]|jgi:hypothetical protein|nr:phage holin family protein [Bifidobacteriaceae bacterium]